MVKHIGQFLAGIDCYIDLNLDENGYFGVVYADPFDLPEEVRRWEFSGLKGVLLELEDECEIAWMIVCGALYEDPRDDLGIDPPSAVYIAASSAETPADVTRVENFPDWCQDSLPTATELD